MNKKLLLSILSSCIVACATVEPVPRAPAVVTDGAKACTRACQSEYSSCSYGCNMNIGEDSVARCANNCSRVLKDCYRVCE